MIQECVWLPRNSQESMFQVTGAECLYDMSKPMSTRERESDMVQVPIAGSRKARGMVAVRAWYSIF